MTLQQKQLEQINAYLLGDMDEQERISFEQELSNNPELQAEMECMQDTLVHMQSSLEADAPGSARVAQLQAPMLKQCVSSSAWLKRLAVAALFVLGFGLGLWVQKESNLLGSAFAGSTVVETEINKETSSNPTLAEATPTPQPKDSPQADQSKPRFAKLSERIRTREQNERLIIETNQSYWIVDGRFQFDENDE